MSCERFLALGQRRAGAERVNPLPDAVPSSRPLRHGPRARCPWGCRGGARGARCAGKTRSFSVIGLVCAFGGLRPPVYARGRVHARGGVALNRGCESTGAALGAWGPVSRFRDLGL